MKRLTYIIIGTLFTLSINAQKLKTVHSIVKEVQSEEWYLEQAELWKKEIKKNKKNGTAWYNYYSAYRALKNLNWDEKIVFEKYIKICNEIADDAYKAIPKTFEGNHIVWWNSGNNPDKIEFLNRAYKYAPDNPRVIIDKLTLMELNNEHQTDEFSSLCKEYYRTNEISSGIYNWAYNILSELPQDAVIFTAGDNDTYSLWIIQQEKNYRKDVTIINTSLILRDDYRKKVFEDLKWAPFEKDMEACKTREEYHTTRKELFEHMFTEGMDQTYVSVSAIGHFSEDFNDQLHLIGLSYKYSLESFDNLSLMVRNYEKKYLLDYLSEQFEHHISAGVDDQFKALYLPLMTKLYKHYVAAEQNNNASELKKLLTSIAEKNGKTEEILPLFD